MRWLIVLCLQAFWDANCPGIYRGLHPVSHLAHSAGDGYAGAAAQRLWPRQKYVIAYPCSAVIKCPSSFWVHIQCYSPVCKGLYASSNIIWLSAMLISFIGSLWHAQTQINRVNTPFTVHCSHSINRDGSGRSGQQRHCYSQRKHRLQHPVRPAAGSPLSPSQV